MMLRGTIQYTRSPLDTAKALRAAVKYANAGAVKRWHSKWMPGHFQKRAQRKYKYQPRAGQSKAPTFVSKDGKVRSSHLYFWRKKWEQGHTRPLVWSGDSERQARQMLKVRASSKRGTGIMSLPRYFYAYRKDLDQPDKAAELTATTITEVRDLGKKHHQLVTGHLNRVRKNRTRKAA